MRKEGDEAERLNAKALS